MRLVLASAMSRGGMEEVAVSFLDISRAHPHCEALRADLFIELPEEAGAPEGHMGRLVKSLYGLRDAPKAFEKKVRELMLGMGFVASPTTRASLCTPSVVCATPFTATTS